MFSSPPKRRFRETKIVPLAAKKKREGLERFAGHLRRLGVQVLSVIIIDWPIAPKGRSRGRSMTG